MFREIVMRIGESISSCFRHPDLGNSKFLFLVFPDDDMDLRADNILIANENPQDSTKRLLEWVDANRRELELTASGELEPSNEYDFPTKSEGVH